MLSGCYSLEDLMGLATIMKTWVDPGGDRRVVAARGPLWVTVASVITLVKLLTYVSRGRIVSIGIEAHIYFYPMHHISVFISFIIRLNAFVVKYKPILNKAFKQIKKENSAMIYSPPCHSEPV